MTRRAREPRRCDLCGGAKNVRLTAYEDGTLYHVCGPCRHSASRRSEEAEEAGMDPTPNDSENAASRRSPTRADPRVCSNCGDEIETGTGDCCEECGGRSDG
ncbi:hypothetical protein LCGC14_0813780 [marine sediment metagenome]|uniref:Uncharacterized protein n=1 Tax=marine sediment metagenome TaxID=412755 RepID=A0A0F9S5V6_9ZZZZ